MPLLDHFHSPLAPRRHWESFHVNWAGAMADALNEHLLPEGYFAEEHAQIGARVEIDVATFDDSRSSSPGGGPITTLPARVWAPPAAAMVIPAAFPDRFEVLVFESEGGAQLVAAIELVSPANKDRDAHRQAFAIKCASYLCQGISVIVIDIVTSRRANLHNEMMRLMGHGAEEPVGAHFHARWQAQVRRHRVKYPGHGRRFASTDSHRRHPELIVSSIRKVSGRMEMGVGHLCFLPP